MTKDEFKALCNKLMENPNSVGTNVIEMLKAFEDTHDALALMQEKLEASENTIKELQVSKAELVLRLTEDPPEKDNIEEELGSEEEQPIEEYLEEVLNNGNTAEDNGQ